MTAARREGLGALRERGRVLQPIREALGPLDGLRRPTRGDGASDARQLTLHGPTQTPRSAAHERIEPRDRVVEPLDPIRHPPALRRPVLVEADDLTHDTTLPRRSDTLQDPAAFGHVWVFARSFSSVRNVSNATIATI